jgi:hypothetical protein
LKDRALSPFRADRQGVIFHLQLVCPCCLLLQQRAAAEAQRLEGAVAGDDGLDVADLAFFANISWNLFLISPLRERECYSPCGRSRGFFHALTIWWSSHAARSTPMKFVPLLNELPGAT